MRKRWMAGVCLALLMISGSYVAKTERTLQTLEAGVLRLHILAASDDAADQARKLAVRDALLIHAQEWMTADDSIEQVMAEIPSKFHQMQAIAESVLADAGCADAVTISLCTMPFPARTYASVTLPAGMYHAVRVCIGAGAGANWWCVMYPSLCVPVAYASPDQPTPAQSSTSTGAEDATEDAILQTMETHFDAEVCELVTAPQRYTVRLKCVEWWRAICALLHASDAPDGDVCEDATG